MALKAAVELALTLLKWGPPKQGEVFASTVFLGSVVFVVGVLVTIGIGMLRVFFAYQCEDHVWNLFTGCVEL